MIERHVVIMHQNGDNIIGKQRSFIVPTYSPELLFVRGVGSWLWDINGDRYLDFATGIAVCSLGHCHPAVTDAISRQASTLVHVSNLYMNNVQPVLAEKIISRSFPGMVFFANSGAEANEGLFKFARKHGSVNGRTSIVAMEESFHGRTLAALAATGRSKYRKGFAPDMPGFRHVPFNDIAALRASVLEDTCAVLIEPVQGEGGVLPADPEFLKGARALCEDKGILLLFDEVQCGMGRTGSLFAFQHYGVEPDGFSLAKALGNGFPVGAFIIKEKYRDVFSVGSHASTFGGTPLACAAACAVLDTIEKENLLPRCREASRKIFCGLEKLKAKFRCIKEVRGLGLMIGVVMEDKADGLKKIAQDKGLLVLTAGENVLRLLPPLNVKDEEIAAALEILGQSLNEYSKTES